MSFNRLAVKTHLRWNRSFLAQVVGLAIFCWLGGIIGRALGLPLPGGLVGMLLVLLLLATGVVRPPALRRGADRLLGDMLLFFVPSTMVLLAHPELAGLLGLKLLAVIAVGTLMVMGGTALTVDLCYRWMLRHGH